MLLSFAATAIRISTASIDLIEGAVNHLLGAEQESLQFSPLPVEVVYSFAQPADILHISPFSYDVLLYLKHISLSIEKGGKNK